MASLLFICPNTHQQALSGIDTEVESLRAAWSETIKVRCPHCGEEHDISVRETFLEGTLYDANRRIDRAL